jgi:gliding motility-associated-like protein
MTTNTNNQQDNLKITGIRYFLVIFSFFLSSSIFGQSHNHASCVSEQEISCKNDVALAIDNLKNNQSFKDTFSVKFHVDYLDFITWNAYENALINDYVLGKICRDNHSIDQLQTLLLEAIERVQDNFWFEKPIIPEFPDKVQVGKYVFFEKEANDDSPAIQGIPKTAACLNANFEMQNHTGWDLFCGTVTGAMVGGTGPESTACGGQHAIFTGGNDTYTNSPRVFQGGASAMLGDGTGTGSRYARLRKSFVVAASNPAITYSYMAVLEAPGHTSAEQPFFNAKVLVNGVSVYCAEYIAYGGDGQTGWVNSGGVTYRDWTSIFVPLEAYIGQTVVFEMTVGDCSQSGHFGYAYVDVNCDQMEVEQFCEGTSTVLRAPTEGISAYQWSTGETSSQITITTPGVYTVNVLPYGSACSALLSYTASIYPPPTADFSVNHTSLCLGSTVDFTNESIVAAGGTITGYQWNYGDGITTPSVLSGAISGVAQTTGTYEGMNSHTYNALGNFTAILSVTTTDGCLDTSRVTINIIQGPQATISGSTAVCAGDTPPEVTFTGTLTPGPFTFTYNIGGGPDQTITTTSGTSVTLPVPTSPAGSYTYNITHVSDPISPTCQNDVTGSATIVVNPLPTAIIGADATVCVGAASPVITFTGSNGAAGSNYQFTYSINGGANQTITTSGGNTATINVLTATPGTYTYTLISVQDVVTGCSQAVSAPGNTAVVTVNPLPAATTSGTATVCQNASDQGVTFTGTDPAGQYTFTYTVNGGPNQIISTIPGSNSVTIYQSTATPGTYVYNLINVAFQGSGCNQAVNLTETVIVRQLPTASISVPDEACFNDPVSPTVVFTGSNGDTPYTFTYNINGSPSQTVVSSGTSYTIQVPTNAVGNFNYTLTNVQEGSLYGCQQIQNLSTLITIHALPNVTAGNDFTVCAGDQIILTGGGAVSYQWDNNVQNGVPFTSNDTTTYTVTGTDINGCRNTDQVTVNVVPIPQMNFTGTNLSGCAPVVPILTNYSTGNLTNCTWYIGNGQILQGCGVVSTQFNDPGCFDVTLVVSTPEGCSNTMTRTDYVCVDSNPIADFYPNPADLSTYQWESEMVNESTGATQYIWDFGDGSPLNHEVSPTHEFPNEGGAVYTITLVAVTDAGCVDTAFATVNIKDELIFYVPNTFTPDGDAFNETFKPVFTAGYDPYNYSLYIYNRWGEMVFESHDANVGWNGRYGVNGNICQDGAYTWKIEIKRKSNDERKMYVGHVNIIR